MGLLRAAVPGSPLLMLQYSFSLHIVVSDGELKAGGSHPHRMFGSPVASARCEVHMLHVRWSRRAVPCQELALLFVSVSFKIGSAHPGVAVRSYDIRLDCGLAPCQSLTASSTFAMRYERGVHGGELRRQLVIVAESGSRLGASPAPRPDNGQLPVWQSNTSPATGRWLVVAMDRLELIARVNPLQFSRIARQPTKAHRRPAPKV